MKKKMFHGPKTSQKLIDSPGHITQATAFTEDSELSNISRDINSQPSILSFQKREKDIGFSPFVAICFTVNYIMGTGFLALPWAFVQGGLISSSISLLVIAIISDISKNFLLIGMARAEKIVSQSSKNSVDDQEVLEFENISPLTTTFQYENVSNDCDEYDNNDSTFNEKKPLHRAHSMTPYGTQVNYDESKHENFQEYIGHLHQNVRMYPSKTNNDNWNNNLLSVKDRKFEIPELCRLYLGKKSSQLYTSFISFYLYLALWAYTSVFASALAKEIPIFDSKDEQNHAEKDYVIYVLLFALIVVPLTCRELKEQIVIQVILAACRILMVSIMTITVFAFKPNFNDMTGLESVKTTTPTSTTAPMFHLSGLYHTLPIIVYAFIFHHSIPGLSHPVSRSSKRQLKSIFQSTFVISGLGYTFIGICVGYFFGVNINESSNLNWKEYRGGTGELVTELDSEGNIIQTVWTNVAWWAKTISFFIVSFPALDVASAFPLNAITLGNNLLNSFYGDESHVVEASLFFFCI